MALTGSNGLTVVAELKPILVMGGDNFIELERGSGGPFSCITVIAFSPKPTWLDQVRIQSSVSGAARQSSEACFLLLLVCLSLASRWSLRITSIKRKKRSAEMAV